MNLPEEGTDRLKRKETAAGMQNSYKSPYEHWKYRKASPKQSRYVMLVIGIFTVLTVFATLNVASLFLRELTLNVSPDARLIILSFAPATLTLCTFLLLTWRTDKALFQSYFTGMRGNNLLYMSVGFITALLMVGICLLPGMINSDIVIGSVQISAGALAKDIGLFLLVFIQGASDEIAFRGFLFGHCRRRMPLWMAYAYSSLLYGLVYILIVGFYPLTIMTITVAGVGFAFCVCYFDSLWMAIGMHVMWNFSQFFIFGLMRSDFGNLSLVRISQTANGFFCSAEHGIEGTPFGFLVVAGFVFLLWFMGKNFQEEIKEMEE